MHPPATPCALTTIVTSLPARDARIAVKRRTCETDRRAKQRSAARLADQSCRDHAPIRQAANEGTVGTNEGADSRGPRRLVHLARAWRNSLGACLGAPSWERPTAACAWRG